MGICPLNSPAAGQNGRVAAEAADLSLRHDLPVADALIYARAAVGHAASLEEGPASRGQRPSCVPRSEADR